MDEPIIVLPVGNNVRDACRPSQRSAREVSAGRHVENADIWQPGFRRSRVRPGSDDSGRIVQVLQLGSSNGDLGDLLAKGIYDAETARILFSSVRAGVFSGEVTLRAASLVCSRRPFFGMSVQPGQSNLYLA
jgi:hypothetical protein